jgi:hypothetical protein
MGQSMELLGNPIIEPLFNKLPELAVCTDSTTIQSHLVDIITSICCPSQFITKQTINEMEPGVNCFLTSQRFCCIWIYLTELWVELTKSNLLTIIAFETWRDLFICCVTLTLLLLAMLSSCFFIHFISSTHSFLPSATTICFILCQRQQIVVEQEA